MQLQQRPNDLLCADVTKRFLPLHDSYAIIIYFDCLQIMVPISYGKRKHFRVVCRLRGQVRKRNSLLIPIAQETDPAIMLL